MKLFIKLLLSLTLIMSALTTVKAQTTTNLGVYSTGVNAGGQLAVGSVDSNWTVTGGGVTNATSYVSSSNPSTWIADTSASKWASVNSNGGASASGAAYNFSQTFNVTSNDILNTGSITFTATADNEISAVLLNGVVVADPYAGSNINATEYESMSAPVTINFASDGQLFQYGTNTLTFQTLNQANTPEGLDVDITSATISTVPEPSPATTVAIAMLLLFSLLICRKGFSTLAYARVREI